MPRLVGTATSIMFWEMVEAKARLAICSIKYGERSGNDVAALHSECIADLKSNIDMEEHAKESGEFLHGVDKDITHGRVIELRINNSPLAMLKTNSAVAADYLLFLEGVIKALLSDRESLEREANKSGRTINGHGFSFIGSVDIPQIADEQINSDL